VFAIFDIRPINGHIDIFVVGYSALADGAG
jgi:hypothetical protein